MSVAAESAFALDVSVVIPVRNAADQLPAQLEALASQTFEGSWEVIVADNGSTDRTADVAAGWVGRLPALRVVEAGERPGPSHARNVGAAHARGEWIAFCDGDDVVEPDWLAELWAARATCAAVAGGLDMFSINPPEATEEPPVGGREARISMRTEAVSPSLPFGTWGYLPFACTSNLMVRSDAFARIGGFDVSLRYCEDVDFAWRLQLDGGELGVAPRAVVSIRSRTTPRPLLRQCINYGRWDAEIYRRYRGLGAQTRSPAELLRRVGWLMARSPYVVLGQRRRRRWVKVLGEVVGRLDGAIWTRQWFF